MTKPIFSLRMLEKKDWDLLSKQCWQFNLMQSWEYGEAKRAQGWQPVRYAIDFQDRSIAIVQVLTKRLSALGAVARINRGPIFFANPSADQIQGAFEALNKEAFKHRWLYLSISPELFANTENENVLRSLGYTKRPAAPWGSSILDLSLTEEQLFKNLQNPWPKNLRRTESVGLVLKEESAEEGMELLLKHYGQMQIAMKFTGIPDILLRELGKKKGPTWDVRILHATKDDQILASLLTIGSQNLCTPLVAWADPEAREYRVSNFVYWKAFLKYRELGYRWFDMGGLNSETPEGIAKFKRDVSGQEYTLVGEWQRPLIFPRFAGRLLKGK